MISVDLAQALRDAGLQWRPASGDAFTLNRPEIAGDVFTLSDMTIEPHYFPTGTVLGFNGTTEWALDSVAIEDALWLPREEQLRSLLGGAFRSLRRLPVDEGGGPDGWFAVDAVVPDGERQFEGESASDAYALALLALIEAATT